MEYVTLNNGVKMPILGYGVYQIPDPDECERCVCLTRLKSATGQSIPLRPMEMKQP